MAAKWPIFVSRHSDFGENLKNTYLKELFNGILFTVENH